MSDDGLICESVSLSDKNWFGTGGSAEFFAEPKTIDQMRAAFLWAQTNNKLVTVIGKGANLLIADSGIKGLVIRPSLVDIFVQEESESTVLVTVGAGYDMAELIEWCFAHGFIGLHEFSGIPSSIGGAVYINLHFFQFLIDQSIVSATVMDLHGNLFYVDRNWFCFAYDYSKLHEKNYYLVNVTFRLQKADQLTVAYQRGRADEIKRYRAHRYPTKNTCGSFFRNFFPSEVSLEIGGKKAIWAAYYLDQVGVKGSVSFGGAMVSHQHANMIVTDPSKNPTSQDIIDCAREGQRRVFEKYGILLKPECQLLGFQQNPVME
jgi:UDP-N-acetylmuramate dehydrogenase